MIFNNPDYVLKENNIFEIRKKQYLELWENIKQIVNIVTLEECGSFVINELAIREDVRTDKYELAPTKRGEIVIKLNKNGKEIDLSTFFPILIDSQYILINGMKKIPIFQCFDLPVINRGNNIKIRTNVTTILITQQDKEGAARVNVHFNGVTIPLALLLLAKHEMSFLQRKFLDNINAVPNNIYGRFLLDLQEYMNASADYTVKDFIQEVGIYVTRGGDILHAGRDYLFKLSLILKVDIFSARYFQTNELIDEFINIINTVNVDDEDFSNKRLRFTEYLILAPIIKNIYEFCVSNRDTNKPKYSVNSKQIITECNVSDIVQYDFSINPIEEVQKLSRISLLGPGGFKRDNVPPYIRDMNNSMFGRICAIDTPDRENCGILMSTLPNCNLDTNLNYGEPIDGQSISTTISMIPFLEHNDPTRLQMASSQMRQAILLENFEEPLIKSGCENIYSDYTQSIKRAKKNGKIVKIGANYIIVQYDDGDVELLDISIRHIYSGNMDFMNILVNEGDKITKGDIIVESQFMKNGNIIFGNNLYTGILPYYGYNYEDGMVISDRLVRENILTSIHHSDLSFILPSNKILMDLDLDKNENGIGEYMPLPLSLHDYVRRMEEEKDKFEKEIIKAKDNNEEIENIKNKYVKILESLGAKKSMTFGPTKPYAILQNTERFDDYFSDGIPLYAHNKQTRIAKINIYANKWQTHLFPQFDNWIEKKLLMQQESENKFIAELSNYVEKDKLKNLIKEYNLNKFQLSFDEKNKIESNNYKLKGEKFLGIYFEVHGIFRRPIMVGDKIGNRHGNKGVIAKIISEDKMPRVNGKPLDVVINPLGIISRMNLGQLYELHLSMTLQNAKDVLRNGLKNNKTQDDLKMYILNYIRLIDNTKNRWYLTQFQEQLNNTVIDEDFINDLTLIQAPFESLTYEKLIEAMRYTGTHMEEEVYDPIKDKHIMNPIATGYMYIYRIIHIAEEKLSSRSIGPYTKRTLQPLRGRKNKGGQRLGEMEVACLIGHDALVNLYECLTLKSDGIDMKNEWLKNQISKDLLDDEPTDGKVEAVRLLESYLKVLGIEY